MEEQNNVSLLLLKALLSKELYDQWGTVITKELEGREIQRVLSSIKAHYDSSDKDIASIENLELLFFKDYPALRKGDSDYYTQVFKNLATANPDPEFIAQYLNTLQKNEIALEIATRALELSEGRGEPSTLAPLLERLLSDSEAPAGDEELITNDLNEIFEKQIDSPGLKWRLQFLNHALGPLRKGDFGFIFKRPETGGTTFLADQVSFMVGQMEQPVLWINNEEQGEKVKLRCFQAAMGLTLEGLREKREEANEKFRDIGGERILIPSNVSMSLSDVSRWCNTYKPGLIVIDQLDKITGFEADRKDLEYGAIYRWARELAKKYAPVIGVCQASASAENKMWLSMEDVAESKTSKQAEADWILGIGCLNEEGKRNLRYFNICKNKLLGGPDSESRLRHGRATVKFFPDIARYMDI